MTTIFGTAHVIDRGPGMGEQRLFRFDNGYGASVVRGPYSYGGPSGLWELAVTRLTGDHEDDFVLCYDTPVTDDVIGWLSSTDVDEKLGEIAALPAVQ